MFTYTTEMNEYLKSNINGIGFKELASRFNAKFNCDKSIGQLTSHCHQELKCHTKYYPNYDRKELVGSVMYHNGVKYIKVSTKRLDYKSIATYMYEKLTGEVVPKNYYVFFIDGNKENYAIDNMVVLKKQQIIGMGAKGWLDNDNVVFRKTCVDYFKLKEQIIWIK